MSLSLGASLYRETDLVEYLQGHSREYEHYHGISSSATIAALLALKKSLDRDWSTIYPDYRLGLFLNLSTFAEEILREKLIEIFGNILMKDIPNLTVHLYDLQERSLTVFSATQTPDSFLVDVLVDSNIRGRLRAYTDSHREPRFVDASLVIPFYRGEEETQVVFCEGEPLLTSFGRHCMKGGDVLL